MFCKPRRKLHEKRRKERCIKLRRNQRRKLHEKLRRKLGLKTT